jgi:malate synthase
MHERVTYGTLAIDQALYDFLLHEVLPGTQISVEEFWNGFEAALLELAPLNRQLLRKRDVFQSQLDSWYKQHQGYFEPEEHHAFLKEIGYWLEEGEAFAIEPGELDPEIAEVAAPQLVVPADNARYALNAANARWGSLLDVLYGTDMIEEVEPYAKGLHYNPKRGEKVFEFVYAFLDRVFALSHGSYAEVERFEIENNALVATLLSGEKVGLQSPEKWVGYTQERSNPGSFLLKNNGLHVEIQIDPQSPIGRSNLAGIKDVIVESALSAIQDCEDSVAAVDTEDKIGIYRNWNGMMKGDLNVTFENKGKTIYRTLNPDKHFVAADDTPLTLKGRVLLLIRNVGLHMYTSAVTCNDKPIPEGFLDAFVSSLCALHDLAKDEGLRNSVTKKIYIVKPKCHGPEEIAFVNKLFTRVEEVLKLPKYTIKMGIMDEERRTSINLAECIRQAKNRVFFINTGFLDRTGDEIHSVMEYGPVLPKEEMKQSVWLKAYENHNVDEGVKTGFIDHAQIGKGMWTMPDAMLKMHEVKIAHPLSGATTAWVPSPTAASIHALHYHYVDVKTVLEEIKARKAAKIEDILTPPLLKRVLSAEEVRQEIENNIQSILGYVVRWVDQGIGCSKVPDIHDVELMEDRATLRISSQHLANWLHHGIVNDKEVKEAMRKMAVVVDGQNAHDPLYHPMAQNFEKSVAFQAANDLIFKGRVQPNGYTEFILHEKRKEVKEQGY